VFGDALTPDERIGRLALVDRMARSDHPIERGLIMNSIIYIVGAVVIILAILSFLGLR